MKKYILLTVMLTLSVVTSAFGQEVVSVQQKPRVTFCDAYPYMTFGMGPIILLPNIGIGYRARKNHHGFDVSLSYSTAIQAHQVQALALYHFYPAPYRPDPLYLGVGVAPSFNTVNKGGSAFAIAPGFAIGKTFDRGCNRRDFIELHVQAPTWGSLKRKNRIDFPMLYLKYGVSF